VQAPLLGQLPRGLPRAEAGDGDALVVQERAELGHVVAVEVEAVAVVLGLADAAAIRFGAVDDGAGAAEAERDAADRVVVVVGAEVGTAPGAVGGVMAAQRDEARDEGRAEAAAAGDGGGLGEPALGDFVARGEGGVDGGQVAADPEYADVAVVDVVVVAPPPTLPWGIGPRQGDLHRPLHGVRRRRRIGRWGMGFLVGGFLWLGGGVGCRIACWLRRRGSQPGAQALAARDEVRM